jgi:hypothetical protein
MLNRRQRKGQYKKNQAVKPISATKYVCFGQLALVHEYKQGRVLPLIRLDKPNGQTCH